jgi:hypothetical protein
VHGIFGGRIKNHKSLYRWPLAAVTLTGLYSDPEDAPVNLMNAYKPSEIIMTTIAVTYSGRSLLSSIFVSDGDIAANILSARPEGVMQTSI